MNTTTKNISSLDREAWLTEAAQLIQDEVIYPALPKSHIINTPFRVSVGFPPRSRANSKTIAICIASKASADLTNEIFITPQLDDSFAILEALTHEMVHQADDCHSGHRNFFASVARRIGLDGKLTATHADSKLSSYLLTVVRLLGDIPHAAINIDTAKKKQTTRMIKIECDSCGFHFRTTQAQIDNITSWNCLSCDYGELQIRMN